MPPDFNDRDCETRWSVLQRLRRQGPAQADDLDFFCRAYYSSIYAYFMSNLKDKDAAEDVTQAFFTWILQAKAEEQKWRFSRADKGKGKFRHYIVGAARHFLLNWNRRTTRERTSVSWLDLDVAHQRWLAGAKNGLTPDDALVVAWARDAWHKAVALLGAEQRGKPEYLLLEARVIGEDRQDYESLAAEWLARFGTQTNPNAIAARIYRHRKRFKEILSQEISATCDDDERVLDELRQVFSRPM